MTTLHTAHTATLSDTSMGNLHSDIRQGSALFASKFQRCVFYISWCHVLWMLVPPKACQCCVRVHAADQ